jgi:lipopolysaccharide export system protein LptA
MPQNRRDFMKKFPTLVCVLALACACAGRAQEPKAGDTGKLSPAADDGEKKSPAVKPAAGKRGPTEITATKEASFDSKLRMAVFLGNVRIDDPEFTLTSEKLTVYMKKQTLAPDPKAAPGPGPAAANGGGGLEKAIAEGNVVINKIQPDGGGGDPVRYIGKAAKVEYNANTGDAILSGWPQVQQGINMHVSTEASTVMYLNREGRMRSQGGTQTTIVDPGPGNPLEHK